MAYCRILCALAKDRFVGDNDGMNRMVFLNRWALSYLSLFFCLTPLTAQEILVKTTAPDSFGAFTVQQWSATWQLAPPATAESPLASQAPRLQIGAKVSAPKELIANTQLVLVWQIDAAFHQERWTDSWEERYLQTSPSLRKVSGLWIQAGVAFDAKGGASLDLPVRLNPTFTLTRAGTPWQSWFVREHWTIYLGAWNPTTANLVLLRQVRVELGGSASVGVDERWIPGVPQLEGPPKDILPEFWLTSAQKERIYWNGLEQPANPPITKELGTGSETGKGDKIGE